MEIKKKYERYEYKKGHTLILLKKNILTILKKKKNETKQKKKIKNEY